MEQPKIVIVGGGAGGLELATQLGKKYAKKGKAQVTLIDRNPTHLWKPLLHEVATGVMDSNIDDISYRAVARSTGFDFVLGNMAGLDRSARKIKLAAYHDSDNELIMPEREVDYDYLVLAMGSVTNDFGTPGVAEHCIFLDSPSQAQRFHQSFLNMLMRLNSRPEQFKDGKANILIVGGGATGVELSAELVSAAETVKQYGFKEVNASKINISLLEAGPRLLPALPERISYAAARELSEIGVTVRTGNMVTSAEANTLNTKEGEALHGDLIVWAAGVRGPDLMHHLDGLSLQRTGQLTIHDTLQSVDDERIFAIGDCAACPQGDKFVPPRAQSAHQQASHLLKNFKRLFANQPLKPFVFVDRGSLVSLSQYSAVGTLMGNLSSGSLRVEGRIARLMYVSLYRMHQIAIYGLLKTGLIAITDRIHRVIRPRLKLH
ncbi:NAD(P)/FAD-dependent oxidoreductase [Salinibius halmophilus]|uniref:NAD(P)/FAD-dependent oxidoreductase n=1 Tax=Salinibius halmophilus TaxID=1853216 RepID=UPI000E668DAB|nr:NAD(P)/FAD-dependent oxidoreductase [Salinibius halmophilus]